jgi:hypothetical protein
MTITRHNWPLWLFLVRLKLRLWRYLATKAALRAVRRVCDRIAPAG